MTDPLLRLIVRGTPGTAGSKSAFPIWRTKPDGSKEFVKVAQVEKDLQQVKGNWRQRVMAAAEAQIVDPDTERIRPPFPLDEAVVASMVFTVKKPASAPKTRRTWPDRKPDADKFARATADALIAAGVIRDDGRIVRYRDLAKVFPREDPLALETPGAQIVLWRAIDLVGQRPVVTVQPLFDPTPEPESLYTF